ncbi:MAG: ROK family transcriptional regulator [Oscillospiraceae bacterium]|nr:ROK family transcriptional regulator [Oscillospiraceae bacterium]
MEKSQKFEHTLPVADLSVSRIINQKALIEAILRKKKHGISKAVLAKELGLSKPAVSKNVADLIAMGLIQEHGEGEAGKTGGRKPIILRLNETYQYIFALDLSFQEPVCAIGDLYCNVLRLRKIKIGKNATADAKKAKVWRILQEMADDLDIPMDKIGLVMISQPGVIGDDGEVRYPKARHGAWIGIGLKKYLREQLQVPVLVENDVNLAAIGEAHFGADENLQDLMYIICGIGLGSGIILGGKLWEGCNRAAGEIGDFLRKDGRSAEDVVAIGGLIEHIAPLLDASKGQEELTFSRVVELVKAGDPIVTQAIYEVGCELGYIIYNYNVMLDIPIVILGGDCLKLGKTLFDGIESVLEQKPPLRPKVIPSTLKEAASILGGFVVGKNEILNKKIEENV